MAINGKNKWTFSEGTNVPLTYKNTSTLWHSIAIWINVKASHINPDKLVPLICLHYKCVQLHAHFRLPLKVPCVTIKRFHPHLLLYLTPEPGVDVNLVDKTHYKCNVMLRHSMLLSTNPDPLVLSVSHILAHYLNSALSMTLICINLHANAASAVCLPQLRKRAGKPSLIH